MAIFRHSNFSASFDEGKPTTLGFVSLLLANISSTFCSLSAFVPADGTLSSFCITSTTEYVSALVRAESILNSDNDTKPYSLAAIIFDTMYIKKLWTKLFTQNNEADEIALHVSGATVRHKNPFEDIEVPRNDQELTEDFVDKWVVPFYMTSLSNSDDTTIKSFADTAKEIDKTIVLKLLSDFNWRTRITGALFSAIKNYQEFEDIIGRHLLKSEVCYAGSGYCLALAIFGTDNAKKYLTNYLAYYLDRKDLWFDQADAFCALEYLDKTSANKLMDKWTSFVADKEYWSLDRSRKHFSNCMLTLDKIKKANNEN